MPSFTTTARYALRWLTGSNVMSDIDAGFQALAEDVDSKMIGYSSGAGLGSRPTSTLGTPGVAGRRYRDTTSGALYEDTGTGWERVPRVVGVASATWDPPSIANGASASNTALSLAGALTTDVALASFALPGSGVPAVGLVFSAAVISSTTGNVRVTVANLSGGAVDSPSGTLTVVVLRP